MTDKREIIIVWPEGHPEDAKKAYRSIKALWFQFLFGINWRYAWTRNCVATFWPMTDEHFDDLDAQEPEQMARKAEQDMAEVAHLRLKHAINEAMQKRQCACGGNPHTVTCPMKGKRNG